MHAFVAIVCCLAQAPAADAAAQVRAAVRNLDAPQKATRDDAERRLIELGPTTLPLLPAAKASDSAEFTQRLDRIRLALLKAKTQANLHGARVTLDVNAASLAEVMAEIERQTGNKLIDYRRQFGQSAEEIAVTLSLKDAPFWTAVDRLTAAAGLEVYHFAQEDGLALVARTNSAAAVRAPIADSGAFRTRIRRLSTSRAFDESQAELQLELDVAWEPRLRPMFFTAAVAALKLVDDAERPIPAANPDLVLELPPQGRASKIDLKLTFVAPPRTAKQLNSVAGEIEVLLPADQHTFRFGNLTDGERQEQRAAAAVVKLDSVRVRADTVETTVRLKYEHPTKALESHRAWFYKNPAFLEDPQGKRTPPGSIELVRQADDELTLRMQFPEAGDAERLTFVYQTPADLVSLPIRFEFTDLPLP